MNTGWLLQSRTLGSAFVLAVASSLLLLLFSSDGVPSLRKREAELRAYREDLFQKSQANRQLLEEVRRLSAKDPELLEALARKHGYARPGEKVYTFGGQDRR